MKDDNSHERVMVGVAIVLMIIALILLMGCSSTRSKPCPDPEPVIELKEVPKPYPVVIQIETLDPLELPDYPQPPGHDASEAEWKIFAQEVKRIAEERGAKKDARIEALQQLIDDHNRLKISVTEPEDPPDPTPP
jgi:hypothetical protein